MERLWAPWRMAYIKKDDAGADLASRKSGCIFCEKHASPDMATNLVIFKGELSFVLMNKFPYNSGHLMVTPYQHTSAYHLLAADVLAEMDQLTQRALNALESSFKPDGYNTGMNLGAVAGAGIADHLHLHIVPRWSGDSNFMPVIGETKVMPESLENSYHKIVNAWR